MLFKKISILTMILSAGLMLLSAPLNVFAQESDTSEEDDGSHYKEAKEIDHIEIQESENGCDSTSGGEIYDAEYYTKGTTTTSGQSYIAVEITEPLSGINEKIQSGDLTVSEVKWKFTCKIFKEVVVYKDGSKGEETTYSPQYEDSKKSKSISVYLNYDQSCPTNQTCTLVQIIKGTSGASLIKTYIAIIYRWGAGIVGIIAVLVIVISGIQIAMDQGSGDQVSAAKTRIMESIAGLVVLFLSALILYTINPTFFQY